VIAHNLEGMREVIADGVTGFLLEPGDIDTLAERIDELLENPDLRKRMGEAGYRMMRERFSIEKRISGYIDLYREVCRR
jgi:glycosyltransferase involved in cell wall biosynthesis